VTIIKSFSCIAFVPTAGYLAVMLCIVGVSGFIFCM